MQRYCGESLGAAPRIVVLGSCKVGNFVVSTPLLKGLKRRWPDACIEFIGSEVTADLETACPWISWRCSWDSSAAEAGQELLNQLTERQTTQGHVDLAINLDGFNPVTQVLTAWLRPRYAAGGCLHENLRRTLPLGDKPQQRFLGDPDWDSIEFLARYSDHFKSNYIAELFCQIAFIEPDDIQVELESKAPGFEVPDILIHCTTARAAKVWPYEYWLAVVKTCITQNFSVGLVGSTPATQRNAYNSEGGEEQLIASADLIDLRGKTSLIELAGACRLAAAVVSVDAGPMHIAAAVGTPTLAIVGNDQDGTGASPIRLWLPRVSNLDRTVSPASCLVCADNRFRNDGCLVEGHPCMHSIRPEQVIAWLKQSPRLKHRWQD